MGGRSVSIGRDAIGSQIVTGDQNVVTAITQLLDGRRGKSARHTLSGAGVEDLDRGFLVDQHDHGILGRVEVEHAGQWAIPVGDQGSGCQPGSSGGYPLQANSAA
jgi:hypothetical protein